MKDTKYYDLREPFKPIAYLAAAQETAARCRLAAVVMRTAGSPRGAAPRR